MDSSYRYTRPGGGTSNLFPSSSGYRSGISTSATSPGSSLNYKPEFLFSKTRTAQGSTSHFRTFQSDSDHHPKDDYKRTEDSIQTFKRKYFGESSDHTTSGASSAAELKKRTEARRVQREGVLSPTDRRVTSPPSASSRRDSSSNQRRDSSSLHSRSNQSSYQTRSHASTIPVTGSSSTEAPDSGIGGHSSAAETLWSQLSPTPTTPGAFLYGPNSLQTDSARKRTSSRDFESNMDAEAAMSSMSSIKIELERKIGQLESERDYVKKQGLASSKYKSKMLDERIGDLDQQLKNLYLSHNALQSVQKKSETIVEHTSQALKMIEDDCNSFEKTKETMAKEITVLREALQLSKARNEKLDKELSDLETVQQNKEVLEERVAILQTENQKMQMKLERQSNESHKHDDEISFLKKRNQEMAQEVAAAKDALESKRSEAASAKKESKSWESEAKKMTQRKEELSKRVSALEEEMENTRQYLSDRETALQKSEELVKNLRLEMQQIDKRESWEQQLNSAREQIEEKESIIENLKRQLQKKSSSFQNYVAESEKAKKMEEEMERMQHQLKETEEMVKLLEWQKGILAKSTQPSKITEPYQAQIDHLMAELNLANDKITDLEKIRDKLVQEKVDIVSGQGTPATGLLSFKQSINCENCNYWKQKHSHLRGINSNLNEQLNELGNQHETLKDVVRSVTPYLEMANSETADLLSEVDSLRRQLADKETEILESQKLVSAQQEQVQYLRKQLSAPPINQEAPPESPTVSYEELRAKMQSQRALLQDIENVRIQERDVTQGSRDLSVSLKRIFVEKNFDMDTKLREFEVLSADVERIAFNLNLRLNKCQSYRDQNEKLHHHIKTLNEELSALHLTSEKSEAELEQLRRDFHAASGRGEVGKTLLEKDGQIVEMKKENEQKKKEITALVNQQNKWITERNGLKTRIAELQTSIRNKEKMINDMTEKVAMQDIQLGEMRDQMVQFESVSRNSGTSSSNPDLTKVQLSPRANYMSCPKCRFMIALEGENLDLSSRVRSLKELVDNLRSENDKLSQENRQFNDQLSSSRVQLVQLSEKLESAGKQLTLFKRASLSYELLKKHSDTFYNKMDRISGGNTPRAQRRFSFSGLPGNCEDLMEEMAAYDALKKSGDQKKKEHPSNVVLIKPQPPRSQSLNRLEEYKMFVQQSQPQPIQEDPPQMQESGKAPDSVENAPVSKKQQVPAPQPGRKTPLPGGALARRPPSPLLKSTDGEEDISIGPHRLKNRPPSPVPSLVKFAGQSDGLRASIAESEPDSISTNSEASVPRLSGARKAPVTRQASTGSLAKKFFHGQGGSHNSLVDHQIKLPDQADARSFAEDLPRRNQQNKPRVAVKAWASEANVHPDNSNSDDDISTDETNRDISIASDLPDDESSEIQDIMKSSDLDGNTSSDSRGSVSPNAQMALVQGPSLARSTEDVHGKPDNRVQMSRNVHSSRNEPIGKPAKTTQPVPTGQRRVSAPSKPISSASEEKLSVRAIDTSLEAVSRIPRETTPTSRERVLQKQKTEPERSKVITRKPLSQERKSASPTPEQSRTRLSSSSNMRPASPQMRPKTALGSRTSDAPTRQPTGSPRTSTAVYNPRDAPESPSSAARRPRREVASSSPNSGSVSRTTPAASQAKTQLYSPVTNVSAIRNDPGRTTSSSPRSAPLRPTSTRSAQGSENRISSPTLSAIKQIKEQYATSSPKPARAASAAAVPWSLDEIDTAIDRLLKDDTQRLVTEADVTSAIDKELEMISRSNPGSKNPSRGGSADKLSSRARASPANNQPVPQRSVTPSRAARPASPSVNRVRQQNQGKQPVPQKAPHLKKGEKPQIQRNVTYL